ncbi:MAG: TfoX/Sxy family protein [Casimicrobiaceae bacterium]
MTNSADYLAHLLELMLPTVVTTRAMFGGHGLYIDTVIVAIVIADVLYFKTDEQNRPAFVDRGLEPFSYVTKESEVHVMSYHRAPDEALDNAVEMANWLRLAQAAALRRTGAPRSGARPRKPRTTA